MLIRSYKSAFILLFLGLLTITVASVAANAYRRASEASLNLSADILAEMSERLVNRTTDIFDDARNDLATDALVLRSTGITKQSDELDWLFWTQLARSPHLGSLYAADPNGSLVQVRKQPQLMSRLIDRSDGAPREQERYRDEQFAIIAHITGDARFDPRTRDWYQGAIARAGALYVTPIYRFESDGQPGISIARAVMGPDGAARAVLGADIALGDLSGFLSSRHLAEGGVPLIVNGSGQLVAYPYALELTEPATAEKGALPRVTDLKADWLVNAYRGLHDGTARVHNNGSVDYALIKTDGATYLVHQQAFPTDLGIDWDLFIVVPEASLLASAHRLLSESVVISLIILCVASFAVWLLARELFVPLAQLERNTRRIKAFQFQDVERVGSRFREIAALDESIWSMKRGLQSLEKFVPTDVARHLIESGEEVTPSGERRELSYFFTGLDQLSRLCSALPPERVTAVLAGELDHFTRIILRLKGTVDNYLGESIMAFWGAPIPSDDGTERACLAALACRRLEAELYAHWNEPDTPPPRNLYSVHSGHAIVGNIGSSQRMSYTALGENVILAWELHRLNHRYGTRILVSDAARRQVAEQFWFRRVDLLPLDDGRVWMPVFELIDERQRPLDPIQASFITRYEAGLGALHGEHWEQAEATFRELGKEYPEDPSVALMLRRCGARSRGFHLLTEAIDASVGDSHHGGTGAGSGA